MSEKPGPRQTKLAISYLEVSGLKSIRSKQSIEIRPLTVLAGANSSGKSTMMQGLLLLKQTLEAPYDPGPLLIRGPNADFTSTDQLLFHGSGDLRSTHIAIRIGTTRGNSTEITFSKSRKGGRSPFEVTSQDTTADGKQLVLLDESESEYIIDQLVRNKYFPSFFMRSKKKLVASILRNRCFLEAILSLKGPGREMDFPINPARPLIPLIEDVIHLPGLRGNPERTYPVTSVGKTFPGTFQNYLASVISSWAGESSEKLKQLGKDMSSLGLTWKVLARSLNDTQVELLVGRLSKSRQGGAKDLVNIADVGFGVSQTLPVAVSLLAAKPGQLVYIEQPEIHLHPKAQVAMAKLLANAAKKGVRVVVETHSSLILLGIQSLIAENYLDSIDVKLHWFERDEFTGETAIRSADVDQAGRFGDWPEDFADVSLEAESRYLDAVEERLSSGASS
jgi:AAA15 family ATPase/GTPase